MKTVCGICHTKMVRLKGHDEIDFITHNELLTDCRFLFVQRFMPRSMELHGDKNKTIYRLGS